MRLKKHLFLLLTLILFTTIASAKQVFGMSTEVASKTHHQVKKTDSQGISFFNLLIEETDNSEDEDDSHVGSYFHLPVLSEFTYPHVGAIGISNAHLTFTKVNHNSTPLFIQFRNIRL